MGYIKINVDNLNEEAIDDNFIFYLFIYFLINDSYLAVSVLFELKASRRLSRDG